MKKIAVVFLASACMSLFADRTANQEWVKKNFAPTNLVPRVEALEQQGGGGGISAYTATNISSAVSKAMKPIKIGDYLWEIGTEGEDFAKATNRLANVYPSYGGCTGLTTDNYHARNYDWYFDRSCVFVVHSAAQEGKFASIGMSAGIKSLTEDFVSSGRWDDAYYTLPFDYVDGMNENGVVIQCNVVPSNSVKSASWRTKRDGCVIMFAIIRYALDRASTALEAASIITNKTFVPSEFKYDPHYLVSDKTQSLIVEDGQIVNNNRMGEVLTNFRIRGTELNSDGTVKYDSVEPYGLGLERFDFAKTNSADKTTVGGLFSVMKGMWYTKTYLSTTQPFWLTEYTGTKEETGYDGLTVANTKSNPSLFTSYVNELKAEYVEEHSSGSQYRGGNSWQTVHTAIYDRNNLALYLWTQEDDEHRNVFFINRNEDRVTSVDYTTNNIQLVSTITNLFNRPTFSSVNAVGSTSVSAIELDADTKIKYYTSLTASSLTLSFSAASASSLSDGAYTWEVILSSSADITKITFSNASYVGNDSDYNPNHACSRIGSSRTAHVFTVRMIKSGSSYSWVVAYNYSFEG